MSLTNSTRCLLLYALPRLAKYGCGYDNPANNVGSVGRRLISDKGAQFLFEFGHRTLNSSLRFAIHLRVDGNCAQGLLLQFFFFTHVIISHLVGYSSMFE